MFKINLPKLPKFPHLPNILGAGAKLEGKLKIIIVVLVIFLVISAFLLFSIQSSKTALFNEYNQTKLKLTQENEKLFGRLRSALEDNRALQGRFEVLRKDLERISSEKTKLRHDYELVNSERKELLRIAEKYARLEIEIASLEGKSNTQEEQITTLREYNSQLQIELKELKDIKESLKQKIEQSEQVLKEKDTTDLVAQKQEPVVKQQFVRGSVDLPTIIVSPQSSPSATLVSSLKGKIINVNRRYNFVVINLGRNSGLREGMIFEVFRRNNFVGKIEVIQLREKIAACNVTQTYLPLKIDDTVRY